MIGRLNHVAIVVPDLESASSLYRNILGAAVSAPMEQPDHGVVTVFVELENSKLELLHPLGEDSPIARFLRLLIPSWTIWGLFALHSATMELS